MITAIWFISAVLGGICGVGSFMMLSLYTHRLSALVVASIVFALSIGVICHRILVQQLLTVG